MARNKVQSILVVFAFILCSCFSSPPETSPSDSLTSEMILISAGDFIMGQNADQGFMSCKEHGEPYSDTECKRHWYENEEPVHTIFLDDYYIDKYEVTNADYLACVLDGVCNPPRKSSSKTREEYFENPEYADYPVVFVSWFDAQTYCDWRGVRLPTEAEWEKAARGTDGRIYPWGNEFNPAAGNFCDRYYEYDDGYSDTSPVGSFPLGASPYGVMDIAGNVIEWTSDWFSEDYYKDSPYKNPQGPQEGSMRTYRGGTFLCHFPYDVRTTDRYEWFPDDRFEHYGFRCASSTMPVSD